MAAGLVRREEKEAAATAPPPGLLRGECGDRMEPPLLLLLLSLLPAGAEAL